MQVFAREDGDALVRVGFTASKKVGNAVVRNRAKRRLRAVVDHLAGAHAAPGRDYVLIARRDTNDRAYDGLERDFESALKRLGAWRAN